MRHYGLPAGLLGAGMLLTCTALADPYPQGALAFFATTSCPSGWGPAAGANEAALNGYFLVPFAPPIPNGTLGTTVNVPLANGEDRTHTHSFSSSINLSNAEYVGVSGPANNNLTPNGAKDFSGTTGASSSGVPYLQLLLCEKSEFHRNVNPPAGVPQYLVTFYTTADCPTGWKPTLTTNGRFIVGLPANGIPGTSFGGGPLMVREDRVHSHAFSGTVTTAAAGIGLASGCCASGYGANGQYSFSGTTSTASTGLPYVIVSQCQTCLPGDQDPACSGQ